jgi:nucleotide-binding universal stress UspA family protein
MKTILVPVDLSDATPGVVETARKMAAAFGGRVVLLHVVEPEPDFVGFDPGPASVRLTVARDYKAEHAQLEQIKTKLASAGLDVVALQIQGSTVEKILHEAQAQEAGLIVMGSHGHGAFYELLVGSVTQGVLQEARCPVVIVPMRGS